MKMMCLRLICGVLFAIGLSLSAWAQTQPGQIKAARIQGEVIKVTADGTETPLGNGDLLTETDTVVTGDKGGVVLVFSNGSTVKVAAGSRLKIAQFKMDPLDEGTDLASLTEEPKPSQTSLDLAYGEIVGDVKKLKSTSNYSIKTPVGAAGIRGTIYRIVFRPSGTGQAFNFQVTTAEGLVVFEGTTPGAPSAVPVAADQEIVVTVDVDPATQTVTVTQPIQTTTIPETTKAEIQSTVQQVVETLKETTFTNNPTNQSQSQTSQNQDETKQDETKQETPQNQNQSQSDQTQQSDQQPSNQQSSGQQSNQPPPTTTPTKTNPTLTPGAGG